MHLPSIDLTHLYLQKKGVLLGKMSTSGFYSLAKYTDSTKTKHCEEGVFLFYRLYSTLLMINLRILDRKFIVLNIRPSFRVSSWREFCFGMYHFICLFWTILIMFCCPRSSYWKYSSLGFSLKSRAIQYK
jgi:hypothetical protein